MSLEFAVQYACPLRAKYSEKHLREWGRLSSIHARLTTGDVHTPSIENLEWVENARDEVERMQEATLVCAHCPACLPVEPAGEGERHADPDGRPDGRLCEGNLVRALLVHREEIDEQGTQDRRYKQRPQIRRTDSVQ